MDDCVMLMEAGHESRASLQKGRCVSEERSLWALFVFSRCNACNAKLWFQLQVVRSNVEKEVSSCPKKERSIKERRPKGL